MRGNVAKRLLTVELERQDAHSDDFDVEENAAPLDGGVGIWVDGKLVSQPACCADV